MRAFKILLFLAFLSNFALGQQLNRLGNPLIRNFLPEEFDAEAQNWSIIQDNRGVMYFGNNDNGILEYDGVSWRKYSIPNNSIIRSLAVDDEGTIYVGAIGDFGYLKPDNKGNLNFVSLNDYNKDSIKFSDVYKTYFQKGKVYFCSSRYIFIYDLKSINILDLGEQAENANFMSFLVNDHFYVGSFLKGLRELIGSKLENAPNNNFFKRKPIFFIIPDGTEHAIIGTETDFYRYNQKTGETILYTDKDKLIVKVLKESFSYHALAYPNGNFGFAFPMSSISNYLEVKDNLPVEVLNTSNGLKDALVTFLYRSNKNFKESPLWLTLNYGISRAEIQSPFRKYTEESGFAGQILDVKRFNGSLYIGTLNGLFKEVKDGHFTKFIPVSEVTSTTWSLEIFNNSITKKQSLLIGSLSGVYQIDESNKITSISDAYKDSITIACYKLYQSKINPNRVYIGDQGGLTSMEYKQGKWVIQVKRYNDKDLRTNIRSIGEDNFGNIWLGTYVDGVARYSLKDNSVNFFGTESGLTALKDIEVVDLNDSLFFNTKSGLYQFDYKKNQFFKTNLPGTSITIDHGIYRLVKYNEGYLVAATSNSGYWIELISRDSLGNYIINSTPFKRLPSKQTDAILLEEDGIVWFGTSTELYSYNPNTKRNYKTPFNALIRKVISKEDTILFNGTFIKKTEDGRYITSLSQQPEQILKLPYRFNRLVFEFGSTFYEWEEETTFSYFLEGGADETWSIWNKEAKAVYTNLTEGSYTFKVKAKNIYGTESTIAEYKFSLAPPWFRTIVAYIIYGILFIVFVWLLVRWNTRRLIAEKERLEQIVKERTAEVVRQKGEIELQRDKISHQNEEIKSSIQYASRIQGAILTPPEQVEKIFPNQFILFLPRDIVSGDFYQITQVGNKKISVIADCTGHGVPGGFMSMLGMSFINQIIGKGGELHPADILNQLRSSVIQSLHQTGEVGGSKDGMDIAIFTIDETTNTIEFSGANNPLILIRDNEVQHIKGDKMPIGIHMRADESFTNNVIELKPGDRLYTFSDGYVDQFGGPDMRKFMIKNFKELLLEIHQKPMTEQREILHQTLLNWHGSSPRIDDVVVMGAQF